MAIETSGVAAGYSPLADRADGGSIAGTGVQQGSHHRMRGPRSAAGRSAALQSTAAIRAPVVPVAHSSGAVSFETVLERITRRWSDLDRRSLAALRRSAPETRALIELQLRAESLSRETHLIAVGAEAVSGSVRRLQQMGGG